MTKHVQNQARPESYRATAHKQRYGQNVQSDGFIHSRNFKVDWGGEIFNKPKYKLNSRCLQRKLAALKN